MERMVIRVVLYNPSIPPLPNRSARRMRKLRIRTVITGVVLLVLVLTGGSALALFKFNPSLLSNMVHHGAQKHQQGAQNNGSQMMGMNNQPVTTINNLNRISMVGSTAFIVDGHGRTISADANPYGVAITPTGMSASITPASLKPADIVVANFGATNKGTTPPRFPAVKGPR